MTLLDQEPVVVPAQATPPDADTSAPASPDAAGLLGRDATSRPPASARRRRCARPPPARSPRPSAAWMVGGLFDGRIAPRAIALLGVLVGCGLTALSFRSRRPAVLQWAVFPVAAIVGARAGRARPPAAAPPTCPDWSPRRSAAAGCCRRRCRSTRAGASCSWC
jgi:hypothetical protein